LPPGLRYNVCCRGAYTASQGLASHHRICERGDGDHILTGDPGDLRRLVDTAGDRVTVVAC